MMRIKPCIYSYIFLTSVINQYTDSHVGCTAAALQRPAAASQEASPERNTSAHKSPSESPNGFLQKQGSWGAQPAVNGRRNGETHAIPWVDTGMLATSLRGA